MQARLKLKPGQKGTKKLVEQYGSRLVCVRYRYDAQTKKRYKTVEIIVDEVAWTPRAPKASGLVDLEIPVVVANMAAAGLPRLPRRGRWQAGDRQ